MRADLQKKCVFEARPDFVGGTNRAHKITRVCTKLLFFSDLLRRNLLVLCCAAMGRIARVKAKKADRYVPNPHAVVPVDKEGLKLRLERHANLMGELLSEGKDFQSLPISVLKTIVRDFQIAGLAVPTPALQKLQEHQQAGLKNRPSPIFLPPVTDQSRDKDLRSELISRGFNPKTGFSEGAPVLPHQNPGLSRAGFALPYVPVHRYGKTNLFTESANKTSKAWLPPWMMYGDQPNQFVKTPRPQSMGKGPSLNYTNNYYQGGRTFGPHMQRAVMNGMQPSVAAFPLVADLPPVAWFGDRRAKQNMEPISPVKEPRSGKADEPSRLFTNRYPVRGEIPPMSKLQEPPNTPAAVLAASGKAPDMIDLERPFRVPARGKPSFVEGSKKTRAIEEEREVRDLIDMSNPTTTAAVRKMPASSADAPATRRKRPSEAAPVERPTASSRSAKKRASDLVKAVAADDATLLAPTPAAAAKRSRAPDAPSKGYVRGLDIEPMRQKADLEETTRKVSAVKRKKANLSEASKKVRAVEELANTAALLSELPFVDAAEGSPPKKGRDRRVVPPRVARRSQKKKAAAKPRAPWKPVAVQSPKK